MGSRCHRPEGCWYGGPSQLPLQNDNGSGHHGLSSRLRAGPFLTNFGLGHRFLPFARDCQVGHHWTCPRIGEGSYPQHPFQRREGPGSDGYNIWQDS